MRVKRLANDLLQSRLSPCSGRRLFCRLFPVAPLHLLLQPAHIASPFGTTLPRSRSKLRRTGVFDTEARRRTHPARTPGLKRTGTAGCDGRRTLYVCDTFRGKPCLCLLHPSSSATSCRLKNTRPKPGLPGRRRNWLMTPIRSMPPTSAVADYASASDVRPAAANTANTLRAIASETLANAAKESAVEASDAAPAARTRRGKQTAALLQPSATPAEQVETASPVEARQAPATPSAPFVFGKCFGQCPGTRPAKTPSARPA